MALKSQLFRGDPKLEAAAVSDPAHILQGAAGPHVGKIQFALIELDGATITKDSAYGPATAAAVRAFKQKRQILNFQGKIDDIVGKKTIAALDGEMLAKEAGSGRGGLRLGFKVVDQAFICGPDVTKKIEETWTTIQRDFRRLTFIQKFASCTHLLLPINLPGKTLLGLLPKDIPTDLDKLKQLARQFADTNGWDTLPLFQGSSKWLRTPPIFDPNTNGPCATPSSKVPPTAGPADDNKSFDPAHEADDTCSNTVQAAGQCWLNGTVNYGTFGVMVRLCSDFANTDFRFGLLPKINRDTLIAIFSLDWAKMLIRSFKHFGPAPEDPALPIAWTEATFRGGPKGVPNNPGNRPKCKSSCGGKADIVDWDYVWETHKRRDSALPPLGRPLPSLRV
jgi:hypothetical protein